MATFAGNGRAIGIAAAIAAVGLGLVYLGLADAPARLLVINAAALAIGLVLVLIGRALAPLAPSFGGPLLAGIAMVLLVTALAGVTAGGAARWIVIGGLSIQPGLMLAPLLAIAFAARGDGWSAAALLLAIIAVALQPDRAVAAMLLAGATAAALHRRERRSVALMVVAAIGFAVTLIRPDALPAVPYVDQILHTAFDSHPLAGAAVWAGTALLFAPVVVRRGRGLSAAESAFAAVWGAAVLAAALANYPTPLVGFGGSAIVGYLLSLLPFPLGKEASADDHSKALNAIDEQAGNHFRFTPTAPGCP